MKAASSQGSDTHREPEHCAVRDRIVPALPHTPDAGLVQLDPAAAGEHAQGGRRDVDELAGDHVSVW